MVALMFWNVGRRANADAIAALCHENDVDTLVLAECETPVEKLLLHVNPGSVIPYHDVPGPDISVVRVISRHPARFWAPTLDDRRYAIRHLRPPIGIPLLIVAVHLPSKLHATPEDQYYSVRLLREDIAREEAKAGHQNTIVLGDFNLDPFEDAMMAADGLHAMMDKAIVRRGSRRVRDRSWDYFYNPMWNLLGDETPGPSATYYRSGSGVVSRFWFMFDQVLLRPSLLTRYRPGGVRVIATIEGKPILPHQAGQEAHSDHLPVMLELNTTMEDVNV